MFRLACTMLCRHDEAQDAVQDVCERMLKRGNRNESWGREDAYWLKAIRNECIDRIRKRKGTSNVLQDIISEADDAGRRDDAETVLHAMSRLPEKQKMVIHMKEIEGYSNKELAALLDVSENQVRTILSRARTAMRDIIEKEHRNERETKGRQA
ncbi:MAG: RNA polymerase sigma factor [Bacteroidales bacterium]|nr:RNA polymerase sigma factor [Bacteroidales bacterium]